MNSNDWIEIIPPIAPPDDMTTWWISTVFFLLLIVFFYLRKNSSRQKSLMILNSLRNKLDNKSELKGIAFEISIALKLNFGVNNIDHIMLPNQPRWSDYKQQLVDVCFTPKDLQKEAIEKLLNEARYWITQREHKK